MGQATGPVFLLLLFGAVFITQALPQVHPKDKMQEMPQEVPDSLRPEKDEDITDEEKT